MTPALAPRGLYPRVLLLATLVAPFALACVWATAFLLFSSLNDDDLMWRLSRLPMIALLVSMFLAPVGFPLGLVAVLWRRRRGPLSRTTFAWMVAVGTLVPFVVVGSLVGSFVFVAPLGVAAPVVAAAIYLLRRRLGVAALFDAPEETFDARVFE